MSSIVYNADCIEQMRKMPENSVDAIVTDPPYGLSFMGKKWDYDVPSQEIWEECLRVLKPGGYLLAFAGTRTQHRMAVRIEDAGFEIRDMIAWVYGSGFPKSLDVGKAVSKLMGEEREVVGENPYNKLRGKGSSELGKQLNSMQGKSNITKGTSEWEGWGTALKPALEPITVARKPLSEDTVAKNVLKWGTGGLDIDGSRVPSKDVVENHGRNSTMNGWDPRMSGGQDKGQTDGQKLGRFPANLIHDGSEEVVGLFPNTKSGKMTSTHKRNSQSDIYGKYDPNYPLSETFGDSGSAARFFYCAKASKSERNQGCENLEEKHKRRDDGQPYGMNTNQFRPDGSERKEVPPQKNFHPTVKPVALMEYLIGLVSRKGAIILDPFAGSGTTGVAARNTGREYILIERDAEYHKIIQSRLKVVEKPVLANGQLTLSF